MDSTWRSITIRDLIDIGEAELKTGPFGTQLHASDYVETGTPVINVRNIGFGNIREEQLEFLNEETVQRLSSHLLEPNDIVFGRKGAVERHAFVQDKHTRWFQGSDCLRLRIKSPSIVSRFVSYHLLTDFHKSWMINQCSHGATMTSLNQDIVSRIPLHLPSLATQQKIVAILSAYDDLIENNTRRIAILEAMARLVYREWFIHFRFPGHEGVRMVESEVGPVPEGWEVKTLEQICTRITDGSHWSPESKDEGYPMASVKDMHNWGIDISTCRKIAALDYEQLVKNDCKPLKGDVLVAKDGSYLKHIFVNEKEQDLAILSSIALLRPNKEKILPHVLSLYLSQPQIKQRMAGYVSGVAIPRIVLKDFRKFLVSVPSIELQDQIFMFIEPIVKQVHCLLDKNTNLRHTRDLLLPRLISGEVEVAELD